MGTRALTVINASEGEIMVLYRQFDGYPDGHGLELADFLSGMRLVKGFSGDEKGKWANGMDCLAAQLVANFKTQPGGIYLYPAGTRDTGEDYIYTLDLVDETDLRLTVEECWGDKGQVFQGTVEAFKQFCGKG